MYQPNAAQKRAQSELMTCVNALSKTGLSASDLIGVLREVSTDVLLSSSTRACYRDLSPSRRGARLKVYRDDDEIMSVNCHKEADRIVDKLKALRIPIEEFSQ